MAYRGHWLYKLLLGIPTIRESSAKTYWYQLSKGLNSEGGFDEEKVLESIMNSSTPSASAKRLGTFLGHYPVYSTPGLVKLATQTYKPKEPSKRATETLPTLDELLNLLEQADAKLVPGKTLPFIHWVVLRLALRGYALRVAVLASIAINDDEAPNNFNTETDILTITKHKGTGTREYHIEGFGDEWMRRAKVVFGGMAPMLVGRIMTASALSSLLRRANISSQRLRPAITSGLFRHLSFDEKAVLADKMGHSVGVQASVYNRSLS